MPKSHNRRKGKRNQKSTARKRKAQPHVPAPPPLSGMKGLLHCMQALAGPDSSPEFRAQKLVYSAWELNDPRDRARKAKRALKIWPDCADAWVLLAENMAGSLDEAHEFYAAGVEAGERALGEAAFTEFEGVFWGVFETRPYMRARAGLARVLKEMGQIDKAAGHLRDMLRLNPNDNQGNRYSLLHLLMEQGQDKEAANLLDAYPDDCMAEWAYARALLAYRHYGVSEKADAFLIAALKCNQFVPAYLLGRRRMPQQLPSTIGLGDNDEAIAYAAVYKPIWKQTPGSLDWLKTNLGKTVP